MSCPCLLRPYMSYHASPAWSLTVSRAPCQWRPSTALSCCPALTIISLAYALPKHSKFQKPGALCDLARCEGLLDEPPAAGDQYPALRHLDGRHLGPTSGQGVSPLAPADSRAALQVLGEPNKGGEITYACSSARSAASPMCSGRSASRKATPSWCTCP